MIKKVVIAGGGTAGWMTAAYLKRAFAKIDVTLIESSNIKTVGVGEASFSTLKLFFDFLGITEQEWMPACNATYKLAIKFVDWTAAGGYFYHPFQRYENVHGFNAAEWWLKLRNGVPFDQACFTIPAMCEANRSPRYLDGTVFDERVRAFFDPRSPSPNSVIAHHMAQYPYGYQFDASAIASYLKTYATRLGVRQVVDDIVRVGQMPDGTVLHLRTAAHGDIGGDLFVDCTGFTSLLLDKTLKEPFIDFTDSLPNDRAVALQVPWDVERNGIRPYTTATALSCGWAWTIPLIHRNGCGYVYCSKYISPQDAEAELRRVIGPASEGCRANHLSMRIGRHRNSWVRNCVAIGLSSGFVEPLESSGIFFIQHGIEELVNHFPAESHPTEGQVLSYNKVVGECIDGVREFLTIHYCATDREDTPYWRDMRNLKLPESLAERMKIYRSRLPGIRNIFQPFHGFEAYSWSVIMLGMNYLPDRHLPALDNLENREAEAMFDNIRARAKQLVQTLPSHHEYLEHQRTRTNVIDLVAS
jgi:tryptophan 6-halogenase